MSQAKVLLYLRVRLPNGKHPFIKPVYLNPSKVKPHYGIFKGEAVRFAESAYYLRYSVTGKRTWEAVGSDAALALIALQRRTLSLQACALGMEVREDAHPRSVSIAAAGSSGIAKRKLATCISEYLAETSTHKSHRTYLAYRLTLSLFALGSSRRFLEDLTRDDLLSFASDLIRRGQAPRTVRNRIDYLQIFLHHFAIPSLLKGKDLPRFTEKAVTAYSLEDLRRLLEHADLDAADLIHFLITTGGREQEVQYACWSDLDFDACTFKVTEKLDLGFRPKDKEEGIIPIPLSLVARLRARRMRYPRSRLIFATSSGKPDGHLLRVIKRVALRAGLNCGHCVNRAGHSCALYPVCRNIRLHRARKTFATLHSRNGMPVRTIQRYLRHSSLDVTLRYLADEDDERTLSIVNGTFASLTPAVKEAAM